MVNFDRYDFPEPSLNIDYAEEFLQDVLAECNEHSEQFIHAYSQSEVLVVTPIGGYVVGGLPEEAAVICDAFTAGTIKKA